MNKKIIEESLKDFCMAILSKLLLKCKDANNFQCFKTLSVTISSCMNYCIC